MSQPGLHKDDIVYATFLGTLMLSIMCGNVLLCVVFVTFRHFRTVTNYFIISLAVSDIFVAIIPIPAWLYFTIGKKWPTWFSPSWFVFIDVLTCVSSIGNLMAISIDRYFGVTMPLKRNILITKKKTMMVTAAVWIFSVLIASANKIMSFLEYTYFVMIGGICVPLLVIAIAYTGIFLNLKKRNARRSVGNILREWKLARTILIIIVLFTICWTPFLSVNMCHIHNICSPTISMINAIKWLHYFNSCCNPIIYGIFNKQFRRAFKCLALKWLGRPTSNISTSRMIYVTRTTTM